MMRINLINSRRFFTARTSPIAAEVMVCLDTIIGGALSGIEKMHGKKLQLLAEGDRFFQVTTIGDRRGAR